MSTIRRQTRISMVFLLTLLLLPASMAVDTGLLYLSSTSVCEPAGDQVLALAITIQNELNDTIDDLKITLVSDKTLSTVPATAYSLGSLSPGATISSTPPWDIYCAGSQAGDHLLSFNYTYTINGTAYSESSIGDAVAALKVNGVFPFIEGMAPSGVIDTSTVSLVVNTSDDAHCRFHTYDVPYDLMLFDLVGDGRTHTYSQTLSQGDYTYYVRCEDTGGNQNPTSSVMAFSVDTVAPQITHLLPSGILTTPDFTLNVTTDETTDCRYSFNQPSFSNMERSFGYLSKGHTASLTLSEGTYTIYAGCQDLAGNIVVGSTQLSVVTPPIATIVTSPVSPVRPGLLEITLTTSKTVQGIPTLSYVFDDAPGVTNQVSLQGHGTHFEGYAILPNADKTRILSFRFKGYSPQGILGTQIEQGKLIIVDGRKPSVPEGFAGRLYNDSSIRLTWFSFDDDIDHYLVYRSESDSVTYADLFTSTAEQGFIDRQIDDGKDYYYRLASVDEAGNVGALTKEIRIETPGYTEEASKVFVPETNKTITLPKSAIEEVDALILQVDQTILDVTAAAASLDQEQSTLQEYAETLGLFDTLNEVDDDLMTMKQDLEALKFSASSGGTLQEELTKKRLELKRLRLSAPSDITLMKRSELEEILTKSMLENAVLLAKRQFGLTDVQAETFALLASQAAESRPVQKTVSQLQVAHIDGDPKQYVFIEKTIQGEEDKDLMLVELFPASFLSAVDTVIIGGEEQHVSSDEPYLSLGVFSPSFSYYIKGSAFDEAKQAVTLLLPADLVAQASVGRLVPDNQDSVVLDTVPDNATLEDITGKSVFETPKSPLTILLLILGILIIIGLVLYYLYLRSHPPKKKGEKGELQKELDELQELTGEDVLAGGNVHIEGDARVVKEVTPKDPAETKTETPSKPQTTNVDVSVMPKLDSLLEEAYQALADHKPEHAQAVYIKIQVLYRQLSQEKRSVYKDRILQLHSSVNISAVKQLFERGYQFIEKGDDRSAAMVYGQIKELYGSLPREFQAKMFQPAMRFYHQLSWKQIFEKKESGGESTV